MDTAKYYITSVEDSNDPEDIVCEASFDNRQPTQEAAKLRVYLTFCIVAILVISGFVMSSKLITANICQAE